MAGIANGQHADVLVSSDGDSTSPRLILGAHDFDDGDSFAGIRLFEGFLEEQSFAGTNFYGGDEPGMNGVSAASGNLPAGYQQLSPGDVFFDVAPITIGSATAELFQWNATSSLFSPAPSDYSLQLEATGAIADALSTNNVATSAWATADANGFFHQHRDFQLLDGDADSTTRADGGVYLLSLTARQDGFESSLPFYVVMGAGLDEDNPLDEELVESAAEYVSDTFGVMAFEGTEIPEPSSVVLAVAAFAAGFSFVRHRGAA